MENTKMDLYQENKDITLNIYNDMDEDERGIAFFMEKKRRKGLQSQLSKAIDGKDKYLSTTEIVDGLGIYKLTTTIFNKWLVNRGLGEYKKAEGQKMRYFHPNSKFENEIAKLGYATTGITKTNKPKVSYKPSIMRLLNKEKNKSDLIAFTQLHI